MAPPIPLAVLVGALVMFSATHVVVRVVCSGTVGTRIKAIRRAVLAAAEDAEHVPLVMERDVGRLYLCFFRYL